MTLCQDLYNENNILQTQLGHPLKAERIISGRQILMTLRSEDSNFKTFNAHKVLLIESVTYRFTPYVLTWTCVNMLGIIFYDFAIVKQIFYKVVKYTFDGLLL
jgi:hypothetical protein